MLIRQFIQVQILGMVATIFAFTMAPLILLRKVCRTRVQVVRNVAIAYQKLFSTYFKSKLQSIGFLIELTSTITINAIRQLNNSIDYWQDQINNSEKVIYDGF